jgi:hypothetical protein
MMVPKGRAANNERLRLTIVQCSALKWDDMVMRETRRRGLRSCPKRARQSRVASININYPSCACQQAMSTVVLIASATF